MGGASGESAGVRPRRWHSWPVRRVVDPRFGGLATKIDEKHLDVGRRLDVIEREPAALRDALRDVDRRCDEISQVLGKLADEQRRLTEQLPRPPRR